MKFPGEVDLLAERVALVATLRSLTTEELDSGVTLCDGWAPRDIFAHLVGLEDRGAQYLRYPGLINKANGSIVQSYRSKSHEELWERAERFTTHIAPFVRASAFMLLGDTAVHHQDILRGLGRTRVVPGPSAAAILREGSLLGMRKLLTNRVEPNDGGRPRGRGRRVRGTTEALGMWLAGRRGIEEELEF